MKKNHTRPVLRGLAAAAVVIGILAIPTASPSSAATTSWPLRFSENFTSTAISSSWAVLDGNTDPHYWSKDRVRQHDGMLTLRTAWNSATGHWESGSVVLKGNSQAYGGYAIRMRCSKGYSKCLALLWPDAPVWPPEIDFYEIFAKDINRTSSKQTLHYTKVDGSHGMHAATQSADFTQWHTVSVWWQPGKITYKLDGVITATMTADVPVAPMHLTVSTSVSVQDGAPQPTGPVYMDLDWVRVYDYPG